MNILGGNLFAGLGGVGLMSPPKNSLTSTEILSMIKKGNAIAPLASPTGSSFLGGTTADAANQGSVRTLPVAAAIKPDDFGMLGLSELIRTAHMDRGSLSLGLDSESVINGISSFASNSADISSPPGHKTLLLKSMISPWATESVVATSASAGTSAAAAAGAKKGMNQTNLEAILPACYNVQSPPHASSRVGAFAEETLFYMFYGMPRDRMQEMAARELTLNRGWRFHKELRLWILPSSATPTAATSMTAGISNLRMSPAPSPKSSQYNLSLENETSASYIVFDPTSWSKIRKELSIVKEEALEDRFSHSANSAASTPSTLGTPSSNRNLVL